MKTRALFALALAALLAVVASSCAIARVPLSGDYYLQVYSATTNQFEGRGEYISFDTEGGFFLHTDEKYGFVDVPGVYSRENGALVLSFTEPVGSAYKDAARYESALAAKSDFEAQGAERWRFRAGRLGTILQNSVDDAGEAGRRYKLSPMFDVLLIFERIPPVLRYLPITMEIAVASMLFSIIVAFGVAVVKVRRVPILRQIASAYVSFTRGTPILIQLYATLYGIPMLLKAIGADTGFINSVPRIVFALVALSLNDAAYSSEAIRAAIQAVDKGQLEAAASIGMSPWQMLRRIVIPETLVIALPSLGNAFIGMIKGTSLVFTVSVVEMTRKGQLLSQMDYRYFEMYITLAIIYWAITLVVSRLLFIWERHLKCDEREMKGVSGDASGVTAAKKV